MSKKGRFRRSLDEFLNTWKNYEEEEIEDREEDEEDYEEDYEDDNELGIKNLKVTRTGIAVIAGIVIVGAGYSLIKNGLKKHKLVSDDNQIANESMINTEIPTTEIIGEEVIEEQEQTTYENMDDLLNNADINEEKRQALTKVWNYISYYNETVATHLKDENSTAKLALSWDEVMAQYLVYNHSNLDGSIIQLIFDNYEISRDNLKNAFNSAEEQNKLSYYILTETSYKSDILDNNSNITDLYEKYENMIIKFNTCTSSENDISLKKDLTDKFYKEIRNDFVIDEIDSSDDKRVIIPLVKAMNKITKGIDSDYKLSKKEKEKFYVKEKMDKELDTIIDQICSYNLMTDTDDELSYNEIKNFAIEELKANDSYNINDRDISNYSKYQEAGTTIIENTTEEETINNNENNANNMSNNDSENEEEYVEPTTNEDDVSDKIPSWMLEEETQDENNSNDNSDSTIEEETPTVEENPTDEIPSWILEEETQDDGYIPDDNSDSFIDEEIPTVEEDTPDVSLNNILNTYGYKFKNNEEKQEYYNEIANNIITLMSSDKYNKEISSKKFVKKA